MAFTPSDIHLNRYADLLINFALGSGEGIKKGEVIQCLVPDVAKPILLPLQRSILKSGGHPIIRFLPSGLDKEFYDLANRDQLTFFPKKYLRERVNLIDHSVAMLAEHDLHELKDTDPRKIILAAESKKKLRDWLNDKEYAGNFTWTLGLFGTEAMAKEAGLSLKEYWDQIIHACYLDEKDSIKSWRKVSTEIERVKEQLDSLKIQSLKVEADDIDLEIGIGEKRQWLGGGGRNIPSFEIFTSPDWRETNGRISFNQPLYRYGNLIQGINLKFKNGRVIEASAEKNQKLLEQMIAMPNADKLGEFSLTDSRLSRITKFMANTLYDENIGGKYGNTHIAIGMAYKDAYDGDPRKVKKAEWEKLGFNDSGEHCDMMSTTDRIVRAKLSDGSIRVIYRSGKFVV